MVERRSPKPKIRVRFLTGLPEKIYKQGSKWMKNANHGAIDNAQLLSFIQRAEKLNEDAAQVAADLKQVFDEAKSAGYDPRWIKKMIQLRKLDAEELYEADELEKLYREAIGL